jgi:hypothetical protein
VIPLFLRDAPCAECAELPARGVSVVAGPPLGQGAQPDRLDRPVGAVDARVGPRVDPINAVPTSALHTADTVGAIGPDRWAEAWGAWSAQRAEAAEATRDLADTLHGAGRLSTRVRDAIVAHAGRLDDMRGET